MSDTISSAGSFTVTINGSTSKFVGDLSLTTLNKSGSNAVADVKNITSGSWQPLNTSSLSDVRYMYFSNEGTSSIIVANSADGQKVLTTLQPNDHSQIAWYANMSGSQLYANVSDPTSGSVLYYILTER